MGLPALEKRMRVLELALLREARGMQCSCRPGQETGYHNAEELEKILKIRCPVHNIRDLGYLRWTPSGMPLRPEDRDFCSCPPCAIRDFLQGERGPLTEEEQQAEGKGGNENTRRPRTKSFTASKHAVKYRFTDTNREKGDGDVIPLLR